MGTENVLVVSVHHNHWGIYKSFHPRSVKDLIETLGNFGFLLKWLWRLLTLPFTMETPVWER